MYLALCSNKITTIEFYLDNRYYLCMSKDKLVKKLRRIPENGWFGGICAGFAYYFELPVWVVRLVWAITFLGMGFGVWVYILIWIFMPRIKEVPTDYDEVTVE